jgi:hypothetical protein
MIYFLDTCALLHAKKFHFPLKEKPEFWKWMLIHAKDGSLKIPEDVYKELHEKNDDFTKWVDVHKDLFLCKAIECVHSLPKVLDAYRDVGININEAELEVLKADPYVMAHAHAVAGTVVTDEFPTGPRELRDKKIPVLCKKLRIPCLTLPAFMWELRQTMPQ